MQKFVIVIGLAVLGMTARAGATLVTFAADNTAQPAYASGWADGANGGFGFNAWALRPTPNQDDAGFFTATATQNGSYPSGGVIDTSGQSWGLYANTNSFHTPTAVAYRGFSFGALTPGMTLSIGMDNGYVNGSGGAVGFVLRTGNDITDKNNGQRFEFFFFGGGSDYLIVTNAFQPAIDTGIGYTDGGVKVDLTLLDANTFSATIESFDPNHPETATITGTLGGTLGDPIQSLALYNQYAGQGQNYDLFFNNLEVTQDIPEPGTLVLLVAGGALLSWWQRRS